MSDNQQPSKQESTPTPSTGSGQGGLGAFWAELKRRKVMRVAITYAVVAWLIIQIAGLTFEGFGIPIWAFRFVMLCVILGFPIAIILAWAFELTPDGIKTTKVARMFNVDTKDAKAHSKKRNWVAYAVGALFPTVIFGALALFFYIRQGEITQEGAEDKSIAVIPFTNLSPDEENAYFADGIHEAILTTLANLGDLRVTSRTSVLTYRDTEKSMRTIGEELNVAHILEGSVQRIGNDFRLTTQLIHASDDNHLWAENFDGEFKDVFKVQSQLARQISESLRTVLSPEEETRLDQIPTDNLEAYDLYLKAISSHPTRIEYVELNEQAVALDPQFTIAWASLSAGYALRYLAGSDRTQKAIRRSRESILKALNQEPENPYVLFRLGSFFRGLLREYGMAEYYFKQVQEKLPNFAAAYGELGWTYRRQGKWKESLESFLKANQLEPTRPLFGPIEVYMYLHDWENAMGYQRKIAEARWSGSGIVLNEILQRYLLAGEVSDLDDFTELSAIDRLNLYWAFGNATQLVKVAPEDILESENVYIGSRAPFLRTRDTLWKYALAQLISGDELEARRSFNTYKERLQIRLSNSHADYENLSRLGLVQAVLGESENALKSFEEASVYVDETIDAVDGVNLSIDRAIALAWLGHKDGAVAEFARLIKIPSRLNVHFMRHCLDFWPLRDHPGFQAILDDPVNHQPLDLDNL